MPTITITGDTTQEALEQVLYHQIGKYGKKLNLHISENLRFENQNKEIKELKLNLLEHRKVIRSKELFICKLEKELKGVQPKKQ